jgi:hypothetical protein
LVGQGGESPGVYAEDSAGEFSQYRGNDGERFAERGDKIMVMLRLKDLLYKEAQKNKKLEERLRKGLNIPYSEKLRQAIEARGQQDSTAP